MAKARKSKTPMFTKRHYEFIADVLATQYVANRGEAKYQQALYFLSLDMAVAFKLDNPKFNREKWLKATVV